MGLLRRSCSGNVSVGGCSGCEPVMVLSAAAVLVFAAACKLRRGHVGRTGGNAVLGEKDLRERMKNL